MTVMNVVGGIDSVIDTDRDEVAALLEETAALVRSGEFNANRVLLVLLEDCVADVEYHVAFHGRATTCIAMSEIAKRYIFDLMET